MTYYNLVLQYGLTDFARECKSSGVHGVIVPDLPIEESTALASACKRSGIDLIFLVAPTTDDVRLRAIIKKASGFVYLVSVRGVTGARKNLGSEVGELISRVKKKTRLPVCVGFGISTPEHARKAREFGADGVIVGSALIDVVERNLRDRRRMLERISDFAAAMKKACLG
jgi:tryptophan synthase alpha chain